MEIGNPDSYDNFRPNTRPRPLVFLLADSWGIGPTHPGSAFFELKIKNFSHLIKNYPIAVLDKSGENSAQRYQAVGAQGRLTKIISEQGLSQLHVMESEKLVDAWHNFNGGRDYLLAKEELKVFSSEIGDRSRDPEQLTSQITDFAIKNIKKDSFDVIFVNLSNLDLMVPTGNLQAAREAAHILDKNIGRLANAVLKHQGVLIMSAAYGRAESMVNMATELPETRINDNPVPFMIVGREYEGRTIGFADPLNNDLSLLAPAGSLEDIVKTILKILEIEAPEGLKGGSLI